MPDMDRNAILNQKTRKQQEIERLSAFPSAPYVHAPAVHTSRPHGVLLSDEIEFYCKNYKLLDPYSPDNIKAANYELRVGLKYSVAGKQHELKPGETLTIPQFEVAVIEILETVNMPDFLIGRWNIRTRWAYKGLVWVGGPQVDAGFRGLLVCPIWNLSREEFKIRSGDPIAVIDFVTTTPPTIRSKHYPWNERSRFVFEDYEVPRSGLVELVDKAVAESNRLAGEVEKSRGRIETVTGVMFTALGVLIAAIAMFATKPADPKGGPTYWWDPNVFLLSWVTSTLTLFAWLRSSLPNKFEKRLIAFVAGLGIAAVALSLHYEWKHKKDFNDRVQSLSDRVLSLEKEKADLDKRIQTLSLAPQSSNRK